MAFRAVSDVLRTAAVAGMLLHRELGRKRPREERDLPSRREIMVNLRVGDLGRSNPSLAHMHTHLPVTSVDTIHPLSPTKQSATR